MTFLTLRIRHDGYILIKPKKVDMLPSPMARGCATLIAPNEPFGMCPTRKTYVLQRISDCAIRVKRESVCGYRPLV